MKYDAAMIAFYSAIHAGDESYEGKEHQAGDESNVGKEGQAGDESYEGKEIHVGDESYEGKEHQAGDESYVGKEGQAGDESYEGKEQATPKKRPANRTSNLQKETCKRQAMKAMQAMKAIRGEERSGLMEGASRDTLAWANIMGDESYEGNEAMCDEHYEGNEAMGKQDVQDGRWKLWRQLWPYDRMTICYHAFSYMLLLLPQKQKIGIVITGTSC